MSKKPYKKKFKANDSTQSLNIDELLTEGLEDAVNDTADVSIKTETIIGEEVVAAPQAKPAPQKFNNNNNNKNGKPNFNNNNKQKQKNPQTDPLILEKDDHFAVDDIIQTPVISVEEAISSLVVNEKGETEIIGIKFKKTGKTYYFASSGYVVEAGGSVIVETSRGIEYGDVVIANKYVPVSELVLPLRNVIRIATEEDKMIYLNNKEKEKEAFAVCLEKIAEHELDMKLVDTEYTFDNNKLIFYFTSAERVDFRSLVKDLAAIFRTRIELRQIGIRDEAKLKGGLATCGRALCCSTFLTDFAQVSIKMAKDQNLSLNTSKISGTCGRLMCCLRYEHETYEEEAKKTPPVDTLVKTEDGNAVVIETNPLAGLVRVKYIDKPDLPMKYLHRDTVTVLGKAQQGQKREVPKAP